jgi:haloalkane dehalogenase
MTAPERDPAAPAWLDRAAYPFRSRFLQLGNGRVHYIDEGAGDSLLFVHGTPTWSFEYRHLIRDLMHGWRCVAMDHLGFGLSERPRKIPYTPEAHAANLAEFVERLDLRNPVLIVHDYGGPIGLPLALDGKASKLVLLNTWMWPFDDDPEMLQRGRLVGGAVGRFMYRWLNASLRVIMPSAYGDRRKLTAAIHRQYLEPFRDGAAREHVLWPLAQALLGSRNYYASLLARAERLRALPALIIWGMKDTAFRPSQLARWETLLPQASVVRLPAAGHWPHEEAPDDVVQTIRAFLEAPRPPAPAAATRMR